MVWLLQSQIPNAWCNLGSPKYQFLEVLSDSSALMAYSPLPYTVNYNFYDIFNWCGGCENLVTSTIFWTCIGHKLIENKHSESGMFFEVSFMVWHTTSLNPWPCRNSMLIFTEFSNTHIIKSFWEIFYWGADLLQFKN